MIDFSKFNEQSSYCHDDKIHYKEFVKNIVLCVQKSSLDKYELGRKLIEFFYSKRYCACDDNKLISLCKSTKSLVNNCHEDRFFAVCEFEFGFDKSVVSRLMNVVDEFGDGEKGLKKEFSKYKYSVLVEMLNLSPEDRKNIKPEWTVSQVRAYKKSLVAMSQQEDIEKLDKPKEDYPQFKSWKRKDFIKRILSLEDEVKELRKALNEKE